jgi:predicted permease
MAKASSVQTQVIILSKEENLVLSFRITSTGYLMVIIYSCTNQKKRLKKIEELDVPSMGSLAILLLVTFWKYAIGKACDWQSGRAWKGEEG